MGTARYSRMSNSLFSKLHNCAQVGSARGSSSGPWADRFARRLFLLHALPGHFRVPGTPAPKSDPGIYDFRVPQG